MKRKLATILIGITFLLIWPKYTSAAQIRLTPSSGKLTVGAEFTVSILADTQGLTVNTAESNIVFDPNMLELESVRQGSTFLLPAPASPNKGKSSAYFGGGLPNPGFSGAGGSLGVMKFKALKAGSTRISVTRGRILLNDGSGTEVPLNTQDAVFTIAPPVVKTLVGEVVVTSPGHSLQDAWSNQNDLTFNWTLPVNSSGASFSLDQNPDTIPDDTIDATDITTASFSKVGDGVNYFHIKARGKNANDSFGPVTTYKVQIDTVAPLPFQINLVKENDLSNVSTTPTINYQVEDATSGVWRYDVYLDNRLVQELSEPPYSFSKQELGDHTIKVIAYDRAGNGTESKLPIIVTVPIATQPTTLVDWQKQWPIYGLLALNLLAVSGIALMLKRQGSQSQLARMQSDVSRNVRFDMQLTNLKEQIDTRFADAAVAQTVQLETLRSDISEKIELEIVKNVSQLREELEARIASVSKDPVKVAQIKQQVSKNIMSEMNGVSNATDREVLKRLYEEFMHNRV